VTDSSIVRGLDGLPVRVAGVWTERKLYYVERYAAAFAKAMRRKWDKLAYIDLLAGPGRCLIRGTNREIDGSPLRAIKISPGFKRFYFSDREKENVDALRKRIPDERRSQVTCEVGDCNKLVYRAMESLPPRTLAIAFLDPEGMEVHFETL
jgi:three-Cys-motif partner protein